MKSNIPALPEGELICLVKQKSPDAFELLYNKYASVLYGLILTIIPNERIAAITLQAVFTEIWENLAYYDASKIRLFTWMYNITLSKAMMQRGISAMEIAPEIVRYK